MYEKNWSDVLPITVAGISPSSIIFYSEYPQDHPSKRGKSEVSALNLKNNNSKGSVSRKASKKLKACIEWLTFISSVKSVYSTKTGKYGRYKIGFVTLTLSSDQVHSDQEIKKHVLKPFIDAMVKVHGTEHYVWKAEAQKNGRIHFHLAVNRYVPKKWIRQHWNKCQEKLGYITRWGVHDCPPSTEILATKHIENVTSYMIKYMCKSESDKRPIEGMIWNSSYKLKNISKLKIYPESKYADELQYCKDNATKGCHYGEHVTSVYTDIATMFSKCRNLRHAMREHLCESHEVLTYQQFDKLFN